MINAPMIASSHDSWRRRQTVSWVSNLVKSIAEFGLVEPLGWTWARTLWFPDLQLLRPLASLPR